MEKIKNFEELSAKCSVCPDAYGKKIERISELKSLMATNIAEIKSAITNAEDIEALKLNTAIAAYMSFVKKIREDHFITKEELKAANETLMTIWEHIY